MNLPKFLNEVDEVTGRMSREELLEFIHDIARKLNEEKRKDFLDRLNIMCRTFGSLQKTDVRKGNIDYNNFEEIKENLKSIEDGKLCLEGSLNEEYDDWYDSCADEFLFEDPNGVMGNLWNACDFLHQCVKSGEYEKGYKIAQILVGLQIMVEGEYLEYADDPIGIDELEYYHLGTLNYRQAIIDAMYVAYCANVLSDRADAVYRMLENSRRTDITMEMVMQNGEELPEMKEFLELWIDYLGDKSSFNAKQLIKEAVELTDDQDQFLENARKYCTTHPGLYERYLLDNVDKEEEHLLTVAKEALERIDPKYVIRGRIALWAAPMLLIKNRQQDAEYFWLEAFRSDSRVVNYLRLFRECMDFSDYMEETKRISCSACEHIDRYGSPYRSDDELQENHVNTSNAYMLVFFGGEFQYVKEHAMKSGKSLGWSDTFMKCGLAAFLLLLLESDTLQQGCKAMCNKITDDTGFAVCDYVTGTLNDISDSNAAWFWKCFRDWKATISMSQEEKGMYLQWVEELIEKRIKGIMEGNYRRFYGECAGYIAAFGEVKESLGDLNGKQRILLEYKALYPRRSAFHNELRGFGMKDRRK